VVATVTNMVIKFVNALKQSVPKIIGAGQDLMIKLIGAIAGMVPKLIAKGTSIIISFLSGIEQAIPRLKTKALVVARTFLNNLADGLAKLADIGFKAIIRFINGLTDAINRNQNTLAKAGAGLAKAIINAMISQIGAMSGVLKWAIQRVFSLLPGWAKKILGISSPSTVFMKIGAQTMQGMADGLTGGGGVVEQAMVSTANNVVDTAKTAFGKLPDMLAGIIDSEPVITPVLDLSGVRKDAASLSKLTEVTPITAKLSADQAASISRLTPTTQTVTETPTVAPQQTFHFEQNNYSPDPLPNIEIYRQTNNQLSKIKSLVGV